MTAIALSLDDRLQALLAGDPELLAEPFPLLAAVRDRGRAHDLGTMVLLTHYEDVREGLKDVERLSNRVSDGSRTAEARLGLAPVAREAFDAVMAFEDNFASRTDGEDHARLRGIAHRLFTPRRVAELEHRARGYVHGFLSEAVVGAPIDWMRIAFRLPLVIVADLLGVPHADIDRIHSWSTALGAANASTEPQPFLDAQAVLVEFRQYVAAIVERQRGSAQLTDLAATLMGAEDEGRLTEEELAALFVQILFAGHETTMNLIGSGMLALQRSREQWALLVEQPALMANAVEELMRFVSPTMFVTRVARTALEVDGTVVAPGQTLLLVLGAAHRDPEEFSDPDRLDVRRDDSRRQLGFGLGRHHCLGAALARLEAQVVFDEVTRRFPDAQLATDAHRWTGSAMLRHLTELPLLLGAERRP
jgi:cytochrome P450